MGKLVLGSWDVRGIAEPMRYLLHYKKVDFEDKRYPANELGKDEWLKEKFHLGMDFPNLPYYIDGGIVMTNSISIIRVLAFKHDLIADSKEQHRRTMLAEQQCLEFRRSLIQKCYEEGEEGKEEFLKEVQPMFQQWEKFLGDRKFLAGDDIKYVDFMLFEALEFYRIYHETILDDYPILKDYFRRILNLPELQEYLNSPNRTTWPILGPRAKFGGGGDPPNHL